MAALARADLESLLRARQLDRTLTSSAPLRPSEEEVAPSGVSTLDVQLGGGWPRGHVSEVVGPRSSGRTRVAVTGLAAATCRGELAALVDTFDAFDPPSMRGVGPCWAHLLWIRGRRLAHTRIDPTRHSTRPELDLLGVAVDRAIKAAGLVLAAGGFGLVVLDLADAPVQVLQRLPFTTWLRLQRLVEGRQTACLLVAPEPLGRGAGGVTVKLAPVPDDGVGWRGAGDRSRLLAGLRARARIVRGRPFSGDAEGFDLVPEHHAEPVHERS